MQNVSAGFLLVLICTLFRQLIATAIPNGILGLPEVECAQDTIDVVFNLQDTFGGRVYVQGFVNDTACLTQDRGRRTTSISIPKSGCGVSVLRSANPPGLIVNVKVLISFHPIFVTKADRGFEISCFYMEADKTATYPLTVNTFALTPISETAEMPRCQYQVLEDGPEGQPATVATVGDPLYHKWECASSAPELWCMTVHSCYVEDGAGTRVEILTADGCAVDKFILNNLDYQSPLTAGHEAHAFKFADRVVTNFQCSIRLDMKRDSVCKRPTCPGLRKRRADPQATVAFVSDDPDYWPGWEEPAAADVDVRSASIDVIDPIIGTDAIDQMAADAVRRMKLRFGSSQCVSSTALIVATGLCLAFTLIIGTAILLIMRLQRRKF